MASYRFTTKFSAAKELETLPQNHRRQIVDRIRALANDARPPGCEELSGEEKYRIRQGKCRVVYGIDDNMCVVTIVKISPA